MLPSSSEDQSKEHATQVQVSEKSPCPTKLVQCPFVVCLNGAADDWFYDVRDALAVARAIKRDNPSAAVIVTDTRTRKLVIDISES